MASPTKPGGATLIHEAPLAPYLAKPRAPLVLIHDGGGTTFSYHCLDPIHRPLWGIQNERLDQGGYWEDGIPGMAARYIEMVEDAFPDGGEILLGGWSLGGLLSLEMISQLLSRPRPGRPQFRILGLIMIDSVYPRRLGEVRDAELPEGPIVKTPEELAAMKLRQKVDLNMTHARVMVRDWELPRFAGRSQQQQQQPPPTILLRAREPTTAAKDRFVDYAREFRMLGWDEYNEKNGGFIRDVVDVDGHHFNMFEFDKIEDISAKIAAAADALDEPEF
ncbi:alpha/beta-hydrolase [Xylariomycetidae sp. FL2044]|nr:alpha/beta-hydrolase [Xylariomycetidae sp. FL2044]